MEASRTGNFKYISANGLGQWCQETENMVVVMKHKQTKMTEENKRWHMHRVSLGRVPRAQDWGQETEPVDLSTNT